MAFGISFGSNKQTTNSNTIINKNEVTNQQQSSNQQQTQTGTSATSSSQTGTQSGYTKSGSAGTSSQQAVGTQQQTGQTTNFSDAVLAALEGSVMSALGAAGNPVGPSAATLNGFNAEQFIADGVASAQAKQQAELETSINSLFDSVGGTAGGNSMAALLANRLQGDAAANIAGVRANFAGQAQQIQRENVLAGNAVRATTQGLAAQLLDALKGGVQSTTQVGQTTESQVGQQAQTSEQASQQASSQQAQSQTQTTEALVNIINQLLSGTTNTTGTESTTSTTKKTGGGFGISI